jgi:PAS domain-containing protein
VGFVQNYEAQIKSKDGRELTVLFNMQLFKQNGKEFPLSIINDVTDLVATTTAKNRLAEIIEATVALVITATADLKATYINKAGIKMLELVNKPDFDKLNITDIFGNEAKQFIISNAIPSAIRNGIWEGESSITTYNGRTIPGILLLSAHKNPDGKLNTY